MIFRPKSKIQTFFPPKKKKKKKRSSPKFRAIFLPISQVQTYEGGSFRMGGAIFHFSQKIGLKSTKNMQFCILHKPMGGVRAPPAPPPGYATGCGGSSSRLSRHTSRSSITSIISLGRNPKQFHPRSSM